MELSNEWLDRFDRWKVIAKWVFLAGLGVTTIVGIAINYGLE